MSDDADQLRTLVADLQRRIAALESARKNHAPSGPDVFPALVDGKQWKEWAAAGGALVDFVDGREVTDDADAGALIDLDGKSILLRLRDKDADRYVIVGEACSITSPAVLGDSIGGSLSVDTTTVGRDPAGSETYNGVPWDEYDLVDIIYDPVTNFALFKKFRLRSYDACGKRLYTGPEILVNVFDTAPCIPE